MSAMKKTIKFTQALVAVLFLTSALGSVVWAQAPEFAIGDASGVPSGQATVDVSWLSDGNYSGLVVQVTYDDSILTPVQSSPPDVDGCLDSLGAPHNANPFTTCTVVAAGSISITLNDGDATELETQAIGTITFDIDGGAAPGTTPIGIIMQDATDTEGDSTDPSVINTDPGEITILDVAPVLALTPPAELDFTEIQNNASDPQLVEACNDGNLDGLIFSSIAISGTDAGSFTIDSDNCPDAAPGLDIDACCQVGVVFLADDGVRDNYVASLDFESNGGDESAALTGEATVGPQSELSLSPDPLDFGTQDLANLPTCLNITATNSGDSGTSLTISDVSYTGDTEFSIGADGCDGQSLAQGASCQVEVCFDSAVDGGPFNGNVAFSSNADINPDDDVDVTGSAASVASLSVNPPSGSVFLGQAAQGATVQAAGQFSNTGSADGDVSCTLTGDAEIYTDPSTPFTDVTIAAGGTLPFTLFCDLPQGAEDGDEFNATLECTGDNDFSSTHDLSCRVREFEPLPIPTMQAWGLGLFVLLMLAIGGFSIRFFRAG